ncbi:MAG: DUF2088 domain-containing protein [candidate division Zixibacteria bacterium]|nr:DUF2088 domain-containing protein [candidate division Zixibacteria bacterium]
MGIDIAYNGSSIHLPIQSRVTVDHFSSLSTGQTCDFNQFAAAFAGSGGHAFLSEKTPLIIVNDAYRETPTEVILSWLNRLDGQLLDRVSILVATGTHQSPTDKQYKQILGEFLPRVGDRLSAHNARDGSSMVSLGVDSLGGNVRLNRAIVEQERLLVIGSVEPHYFAGFTGGRKSIFPGLADLATIERNHNLANSLEAAPLRLSGNPVAEHLESLMSTLKPERFFGVQVVRDVESPIAAVFCGRLDVAFAEAVQRAEAVFARRVKEPYDIVICEVLPPLDRNLYQVQKALENCQYAVRDGGLIVLVSCCREGIGSPYFFDLAARWDADKNAAADGQLHFGSHKLSRVNAIGRRIRVCLHSSLPDEVVRRVFYEPLDIVEELLYIDESVGPDIKIAVAHDAGNIVLTE